MSTEISKRARLDVMLDLESLSTAHNGAVIQIAAVPFQIEGNGDMDWAVFDYKIHPKSSIEAGLDVNGDTMKWWFSQDSLVQEQVLLESIKNGMELEYVLKALSHFLLKLECEAEKVFVWGYPATSDFTWLQNAYVAAKLPYPIQYNRTRCLGTTADLYWERTGKKLSEQSKTQINHDALVDCKAQIEMVQIAYKELAYLPAANEVPNPFSGINGPPNMPKMQWPPFCATWAETLGGMETLLNKGVEIQSGSVYHEKIARMAAHAKAVLP